MPQSPAAPSDGQIPLVVDLDGTLIKTDLLWESLARLLRRNPLQIFPVLFWWMRGRAFLKKQLARRVQIDPASLPYNEAFLKFLREQKNAGRKIILATASDLKMAEPVAAHVGLFEDVLASDGRTNLRSGNKLKVLVQKFGERGFDYAGNSAVDLVVWRGAREAIVVNAPRALAGRAANCTRLGPVFLENYSPLFPAINFLRELFIRSGYLAAAGAGLLLATAFPKPGVAGLAWVAPALMLACTWGKSGSDSFRIGYVAGLSFWLAVLYWLLLMPVTGLPILAWIALAGYLAFYPATWVWLMSRNNSRTALSESWSRRLLWSLTGAAVWVALEIIRARLFGGFTWNALGVSQYHLIPLIQIAAITGLYGVSFLMVWVSLALFSAVWMILRHPTLRFIWQAEIMPPLVVVVVLFGIGYAKINGAIPPAPTVRITLIQPSVPQTLIWDEKENANRFSQLLQLSENALEESEGRVPRVPDFTNKTNSETSADQNGTRITRPSDLLIWPESAVPELRAANYIAITNLVRIHHLWLIFNAEDVVPRPNDTNEFDNEVFNAAFLFDPYGNFAGVYHKQALVIFGEYIPLVRWLPIVKWFTPITDGFAEGNSPAQFEIKWWGEDGGRLPRPREPQIELDNGSSEPSPHKTATTSPLICYEDTFAPLARKAASSDTDFLVNLTNDGWFGESAEQWQHLASAVFRGVENGIPIVRCANNGVTCWIDAHGRIRNIFKDKSGTVYGMGATTMDLPLQNHAQTFYNRHGDWFGWGCVGISLIILAIKVFETRRGNENI
jgi:apolipoprotein N-acyltransferase